MIDKEALRKLVDPKSPAKAIEYLEKHMTQENFFEWLFNKITKQKNNEDKIIRVPTDLIGTIFLQYIQDNFDEPYEEIRDESPNLIEFSPADIPDINGKKSLSDFQFKYFKENCPDYILYLFKEFCKDSGEEDYWYRGVLQYLLKVLAPDCKIVVKNSLFCVKGEDPFNSVFCPEPVIQAAEWEFAKD